MARIPGFVSPDSVYDYCSRAVGHWVRMTPTSRSLYFGEVAALRLAGRYVAFEISGGGGTTSMFLWNTSTHHSVTSSVYLTFDAALFPPPAFPPPRSDPDFRLSANGVAARIEANITNHYTGAEDGSVTALTLNGPARLDTASSPSDLANLQLYNCAAGCAPNTTVVAWTNSGIRRYAEVAG